MRPTGSPCGFEAEIACYRSRVPRYDRLRDRFKPNLSEREAAKHAQWLVKDAYGNRRAVFYDLIQEKQNHIPYRK